MTHNKPIDTQASKPKRTVTCGVELVGEADQRVGPQLLVLVNLLR